MKTRIYAAPAVKGLKTFYLMIKRFDSAILNAFSDEQATTSGGKAYHAIIVQRRNENVYMLLYVRMGAYL